MAMDGFEKAKAASLNNLVEYQMGSVVSCTIVDRKTGSVTLFAFDLGQRLSEHTVPYDALVYLIEGEAQIFISGKEFRLKEGETIIMPANEPHALKAINRFKMLLVMIKS